MWILIIKKNFSWAVFKTKWCGSVCKLCWYRWIGETEKKTNKETIAGIWWSLSDSFLPEERRRTGLCVFRAYAFFSFFVCLLLLFFFSPVRRDMHNEEFESPAMEEVSLFACENKNKTIKTTTRHLSVFWASRGASTWRRGQLPSWN